MILVLSRNNIFHTFPRFFRPSVFLSYIFFIFFKYCFHILSFGQHFSISLSGRNVPPFFKLLLFFKLPSYLFRFTSQLQPFSDVIFNLFDFSIFQSTFSNVFVNVEYENQISPIFVQFKKCFIYFSKDHEFEFPLSQKKIQKQMVFSKPFYFTTECQ